MTRHALPRRGPRRPLGGLALALLLLTTTSPRSARAAPPPEDLAGVLAAFELRLLWIEVDRLRTDPYQRDTTIARVIVQDRKRPLAQGAAAEAAERVRRAVGRLGLHRFVACDVLFYDATRAPAWGTSRDAAGGLLGDVMRLGGAPRVAATPPAGEAVGRQRLWAEGLAPLDAPVSWYARCVAHREYEWRRPQGAAKSVAATITDVGPWQRSDWAAAANTTPTDPDVVRRVLPVVADFGAPALPPEEPLAEPAQPLCLLRLQREPVFGTDPAFALCGAQGVVGAEEGPSSVEDLRGRAARLRGLLERCDLEGLCWLRVEAVRLDRYSYRTLPPAATMDVSAAARARGAEFTCDRLPAERVVPLDVAVEWYALVVDHRPMTFRGLPGPARRGERPAARFATAGAWRSAAWAAEANRARVDDPANVTLAKPQIVK